MFSVCLCVRGVLLACHCVRGVLKSTFVPDEIRLCERRLRCGGGGKSLSAVFIKCGIKEQSGMSTPPLIFNTSLIKGAGRPSDSGGLITGPSLRFKRI